jgi:FAD/FMN-containing dehydrogenase
MPLSNWNGCARFTPAAMVTPCDVEHLKEIVRDDQRYPSPLRAVGELHSLNESVSTHGTVVRMKHFTCCGDPEWRDGELTVTVGAGVRMIDLRNHLRRRGLQLSVVPEIGNATAGSVACCGTKDSSLGPEGPGQIAAAVRAVRMVTADGRHVHVTDADDLYYIRSSYGLVGVVCEVTFAVQPRVRVRYQYTSVDLGRQLPDGRRRPIPGIDRILGESDGFLGFLLPYKRQLLVERRTVIRDNRVLSSNWDRVKLALRTFAWRTGARPFVLPRRHLPRALRRPLAAGWVHLLDHGFLKMFFLRVLGRFAGFRDEAMIDFERPAGSYFDFTFWAFPAREWKRIVPAYLDFCDDFLRYNDFRPALPTEVYYMRKDQEKGRALLSACSDEDVFTLDLVHWAYADTYADTGVDTDQWREMNEAFNDFAARHGGWPLPNQTKWLSGEVVTRLETEGWQELSNLRDAQDPRGRFLTRYFDDLLPKPNGAAPYEPSWG